LVRRRRRGAGPIKPDFIFVKRASHAPTPNGVVTAGDAALLQDNTMLAPAISLLASGLWLTCLAIMTARAAPMLRSLAERSVRRR